MRDKRFRWPYLALALGIISLAAGASQASNLLIAGWYLILGATAYISAKKRKLGLVRNTTLRKILELIAIVIIIVLVFISNREDLINDPVPTLVIPIWAVICYFVILAKPTRKDIEQPRESNKVAA